MGILALTNMPRSDVVTMEAKDRQRLVPAWVFRRWWTILNHRLDAHPPDGLNLQLVRQLTDIGLRTGAIIRLSDTNIYAFSIVPTLNPDVDWDHASIDFAHVRAEDADVLIDALVTATGISEQGASA